MMPDGKRMNGWDKDQPLLHDDEVMPHYLCNPAAFICHYLSAWRWQTAAGNRARLLKGRSHPYLGRSDVVTRHGAGIEDSTVTLGSLG